MTNLSIDPTAQTTPTTAPVDGTAITTSVTPILTDANTLTWDDLSAVTTKTVYVPRYGKYMSYLSSVPFDKMAEIQARYMSSDTKDIVGFTIAVLQYVMVAPALQTPDAVRAARKADSAILLDVVKDVTQSSKNTPDAPSLGES